MSGFFLDNKTSCEGDVSWGVCKYRIIDTVDLTSCAKFSFMPMCIEMKIEYVPFSNKYECLPIIVGVLDTGTRRILAGSNECLKKLVEEHVRVGDGEIKQNLLKDIEASCPLPATTKDLPRDHRALISALNGSPSSMWAAIIGLWTDPERRKKLQY